MLSSRHDLSLPSRYPTHPHDIGISYRRDWTMTPTQEEEKVNVKKDNKSNIKTQSSEYQELTCALKRSYPTAKCSGAVALSGLCHRRSRCLRLPFLSHKLKRSTERMKSITCQIGLTWKGTLSSYVDCVVYMRRKYLHNNRRQHRCSYSFPSDNSSLPAES